MKRSAHLEGAFSGELYAGLVDYWSVYERCYRDMQDALTSRLEQHPTFGPMIKMQTPAQREAQSAQSRERLSKAIRTNEWTDYEAQLAQQGAVYAATGMELREWHDLVRLVSRFMMPKLAAAYGGEPPRLIAAIQAQNELYDRTLAIIGEAYILNREAKLLASESRLAATLNSIGDAVIATDMNARVVSLNPVAARLTGWSNADAIGKNLDDVFHIFNEETREVVDSPATRVLREGIVVGLANHTVLVSKEGVERPIGDSAAPIRDADGKDHGVVLVFRDLTKEHAADAAVRRDAEDQKFVLDLIDELRALEDPEQILTRVASETQRFLGVTRCLYSEIDDKAGVVFMRYDSGTPSIVGRHPLSIFSADTISEYRARRPVVNNDAENDPRTRAQFEKAYRPIGCVAYIAVPLFDDDGAFAAVFSIMSSTPRVWTERETRIVRQILERAWSWLKHMDLLRALEERVDQRTRELNASRKELERSNQELEQFAYVASHDLRAPLRAIDTLSKFLEEDLDAVLTADAREQMQLMRSRVQRMETLLADLLDFARAGRGAAEPERVDIGALFTEVVQLSNVPPGFTLEARGTLPTIETVKLPLKRVLMNLISNAIKHHDKPTGHVVLAAEERAEAWEITITDDGPGIPPRFHEKAFQMFQTLKSRDAVEGSGMGLALVKKLVELGGGTIALVSDGRGCVFRLTWPKQWQRPRP